MRLELSTYARLVADTDSVAWCAPDDARRWRLGTPHLEVDISCLANNDGNDKTAGSSLAVDLKAA